MATPLKPFYQLKCGCNSYPWGKQGSSSLSAKLCAQTPGYVPDKSAPKTPFKISEDQAYAEMWMGTYPTLPSYVASTDEPLQDVIDRHASSLLGDDVVERFGHTQLPFLPKILSIAKALPLQIHPDKEYAAKKHKEDPSAFTDPNHKPEIALALSDFEAFVGFKPLYVISNLITSAPELEKHLLVTGTANRSFFNNDDLRALVHKILSMSPEETRNTYKALISLPESHFADLKQAEHIPKLAPRLADQYSDADPGVLVALLTMNYLTLKAGEAIYIPADGIHAYLSGDIVECMARSDNVLNTGFCPRAERDSVDDFCSLLTFTPHAPEHCMLNPLKYWRSENGKTKVFAPPLSEFNVLETRLERGEEEFLGKGRASIIIATRGSATVEIAEETFELGEGHVYFVSRGYRMVIKAKEKGLVMHTAYVE